MLTQKQVDNINFKYRFAGLCVNHGCRSEVVIYRKKTLVGLVTFDKGLALCPNCSHAIVWKDLQHDDSIKFRKQASRGQL